MLVFSYIVKVSVPEKNLLTSLPLATYLQYSVLNNYRGDSHDMCTQGTLVYPTLTYETHLVLTCNTRASLADQ